MPNDRSAERAQRRLNAKRAAKQDRHKLEELRRQQAKAERRRLIAATGIVVLVGLIIIGIVVVPAYLKTRNYPSHRTTASYGVKADKADCAPDTKLDPEPAPGITATSGEDLDRLHIDADPARAAKYPKWNYVNNPPASGPHYQNPLSGVARYYSPDQSTMTNLVERATHNLEHGYIVIWYDATIAKDPKKLTMLDDLSENVSVKLGFTKYIAAPWPADRPAMPDGKHIAFTAWHNRQLCGDLSGEVLQKFIQNHPESNAPEPAGA